VKVTADYEARLGKELEQVVGRITTPLDAVAEHVRSARATSATCSPMRCGSSLR
jgi:hypothetical protein